MAPWCPTGDGCTLCFVSLVEQQESRTVINAHMLSVQASAFELCHRRDRGVYHSFTHSLTHLLIIESPMAAVMGSLCPAPNKFICRSPNPQGYRMGWYLETGSSKTRLMSLGWAPARYDWCPNERRKSGHTHTEGRSGRNKGEDGHLHVKERSLRRNQLHQQRNSSLRNYETIDSCV